MKDINAPSQITDSDGLPIDFPTYYHWQVETLFDGKDPQGNAVKTQFQGMHCRGLNVLIIALSQAAEIPFDIVQMTLKRGPVVPRQQMAQIHAQAQAQQAAQAGGIQAGTNPQLQEFMKKKKN